MMMMMTRSFITRLTSFSLLLLLLLVVIETTQAQVKLGAPQPIPVNDPTLVSVMNHSAQTRFAALLDSASHSSSQKYKLGKIMSATRQVVAGSIYFARFELIVLECESADADDDSKCKEKARRLCNVRIWKKLGDEELEVKELRCDDQ